MSQITIQNLHFTYDGDHTPVFEGLELQLDTNWKLGLVGRNGRGKTTLLRLLAGELAGGGGDDERMQLLYALRPFLKPERRDKVERAARTARLIRVGKKLLTDLGDGYV